MNDRGGHSPVKHARSLAELQCLEHLFFQPRGASSDREPHLIHFAPAVKSGRAVLP